MKLAEFLFGKLPIGGQERAKEPLRASSSPLAQASSGDFWGATVSGATASAAGALALSAVHRSVSLISGAGASLPLDVKRRSGGIREEATDHWLWPLLTKRPNKWQTPQQFKRTLFVHLLLHGNAFVMKVRRGRRIVELVPLAPSKIRVEQLRDYDCQYHVTTSQGIVTLTREDIAHFVGLSLDGVTGISVLQAAAAAIRHGHSLQSYGISIMENGARFGGALTHPKTIGAEGQARLVESLEKFRGSGAAGKLLVLEEGMKFQELSMSVEDAQFVQTAAVNRLEFYQFFGIPSFLAADTSNSTSWGSGIEAMNQMFVDYTLNDWLVCIEDTINCHIISEPDVFVRFNRSALVRGDIETRYRAHEIALQNGFLTIDEVRALEDLNPITRESGDVRSDGS